jgi:hypothetical protein
MGQYGKEQRVEKQEYSAQHKSEEQSMNIPSRGKYAVESKRNGESKHAPEEYAALSQHFTGKTRGDDPVSQNGKNKSYADGQMGDRGGGKRRKAGGSSGKIALRAIHTYEIVAHKGGKDKYLEIVGEQTRKDRKSGDSINAGYIDRGVPRTRKNTDKGKQRGIKCAVLKFYHKGKKFIILSKLIENSHKYTAGRKPQRLLFIASS